MPLQRLVLPISLLGCILVDVPPFEEIAHLRGKHVSRQLRRLIVNDFLTDSEVVELVHL